MHKIKSIVTISLCSFLIISCATARDHCPLVGKWGSNEKATLVQMEKHGDVTEKVRSIFLNNFFGKLTLEYTCSEVTSYYKDSLVEKDIRYEIIKKEGNFLEIEYHTKLLGKITRRITLAGDCYYVPVGGFTFSEVFCRVE